MNKYELIILDNEHGMIINSSYGLSSHQLHEELHIFKCSIR
jgi:hypothetical protein